MSLFCSSYWTPSAYFQAKKAWNPWFFNKNNLKNLFASTWHQRERFLSRTGNGIICQRSRYRVRWLISPAWIMLGNRWYGSWQTALALRYRRGICMCRITGRIVSIAEAGWSATDARIAEDVKRGVRNNYDSVIFDTPFRGDDGIWTHAPANRPTGFRIRTLQPLGYISMEV